MSSAAAVVVEREPVRAVDRLRPLGRALGPGALVLVGTLLLFPVPAGVVVQGLVLGAINAMVVLGLALIQRANRVVNFAQASMGTFPAATAGAVVLFGAPGIAGTAALAGAAAAVVALRSIVVGRHGLGRALLPAAAVAAFCAGGLQVAARLGWLGGIGVGVVVAVVCGLGTHTIVIRRLSDSPRLVLTVATIGLAQVFAIGALLVPRLWGSIALIDPDGDATGFEVPFDATVTIGRTVLGSAELVAVAIAAACIAVVAVGLRRTSVGVAVRAAADSGERATMLGVPVARLEAGVWVVASVLAFLASWAQAGILGLELTPGVGLRVMVAALAASAVAGSRDLAPQLVAAVAIGVLVQATGPAGGHSLTLTDAVLAVIVLAGQLVRRRARLRSERDATSSWQAAAQPRGLPFELARVGSLRALRLGALAAAVALAAALPMLVGESTTLRATTLLSLVVVAASVVVLTGWAGEVTLGQMSFAATGAAVAAAATEAWRVDLSLALVLGALAGAAAAVVVGLPVVRRSGPALAVTTLAFALASTSYLLNPTIAGWIPTGDVVRRPLLGSIGLESRTSMYEVALAVTVVCFAAALGLRRSRVGRTLRATRDNPDGAQAFGVDLLQARLAAFALSGALAGVGGVLLFATHERYEVALFSADESLNVFIATVVGGVGSLLGAVLGAGLFVGGRTFVSGPAGLLPSAAGVLGVLLVAPGGLADVAYRLRDRVLRSYAVRRGIHVPSLVADGHVDASAASVHPDPDDEPGWLSVRGVDVAYGPVQVLFGVDLDVPRGQITALLGTNGAGKSTLLRAIGGVATVTAGSITFDGVDLSTLRPDQVATLGVGQMPGGHGVFPSLTVEENLRVAGWLQRWDHAGHADRVADALDRFPVLAARRSDAAADLSGGQQQQLALAMALLGRPSLLLVDELSVGLAPTVVEDLLGHLRALRDEGTTIVIVEQSVNVALTVADHAFFMEKGEVRFSGSAADLLAQPDLVRAVYLSGARDALAERDARTGPELVAAPGAAPLDPDGTAHETADGRPAALKVRNLSVHFGGVAAVDHVSLTVAQGDVVGLIGPNGAGKTTLLDLVSGLVSPDGGQVHVAGRDLSSASPAARFRAGLGRSFQDARLFPGLTVAETLAVAVQRHAPGDDPVAAALRLPAARTADRVVAERVEELVELFGLEAFRSKLVGELSTGSRRMVDLACVVAHAPSVVLLDEPTSGIAQREAEALAPVLLGLRDRLSATLVVIEHDISLISSIADRLVALDRGRVVTTGPPSAVLDHPEVVASYLGDSEVALGRTDLAAGSAS